MRKATRTQAHNGYTLIELLLVCGLLGLLLTLAAPTFTTSMEHARLNGAVNLLAADIRLAQAKAQRSIRLSRILFDTSTGSYEVQVANNASAQLDCTDSAFTTVKRVDLKGNYKVALSDLTFRDPGNPNLGCLVFESTGRTDWISPLYRQGVPLPDPGTSTARYLDQKEVPDREAVLLHPNAVWWTEAESLAYASEVLITLDLGRPRYVPWVCAQMIEDFTRVDEEVPFPLWVRVDVSSQTGDTIPGPSAWSTLATASAPYAGDRTAPDWDRKCPKLEINQSVRYLRLVFEPDGISPYIGRAMAIDEIKIPVPSVTLSNQSGRASRTVSVTPNTGRVSVR